MKLASVKVIKILSAMNSKEGKRHQAFSVIYFAQNLKEFHTFIYRHSSIYAVNVGTHKKTAESENRVNRGYLVHSTKGEEIRIEL